MSGRLGTHLFVSMAAGLAITLTGLALAGPLGGVGGFALWLVLEQFAKALLPTSFHSGVAGARVTASVYRGWAARLVAATGIAADRRTPEADAALLASGASLCLLTQGSRNGSQLLGFLVLQPQPDGAAPVLAWCRRGGLPEPLGPVSTLRVEAGRVQQNPMQIRFGFTVYASLGADSFWIRPHDAALLQLAGAGAPSKIAS